MRNPLPGGSSAVDPRPERYPGQPYAQLRCRPTEFAKPIGVGHVNAMRFRCATNNQLNLVVAVVLPHACVMNSAPYCPVVTKVPKARLAKKSRNESYSVEAERNSVVSLTVISILISVV